MDILDVFKKRLKEGGLKDIFDALPDGRRYPEAIVLTIGMPTRRKVDYAGTTRETYRVTTIVKRMTDPSAKIDALTAEKIINKENLESENGSYILISFETEPPRPLPWQESNRYVWAFDTVITTQGKED